MNLYISVRAPGTVLKGEPYPNRQIQIMSFAVPSCSPERLWGRKGSKIIVVPQILGEFQGQAANEGFLELYSKEYLSKSK